MSGAFPIPAVIPGSVTCVFTEDIDSARRRLQDWASYQDALRLVACDGRCVSLVSRLLDFLVAALADAALMLWPDWYGGEEDNTASGRWARQPAVNPTWLQDAIHACQRKQAPLLPRFPLALQARQLALTLAERELVVALFFEDGDPPDQHLLGLARGLEWLARESQACAWAILPSSLAGRRALDGINFGAIAWPTVAVHVVGEASADRPLEERKHLVCPVIGRPHPGSPGEQLLAERLGADSELGGLFHFNQRVTTVRDSRFLVDLVWPEGRVVVEVDGYGHHSSRSAFNADRERDYELLLTGYHVLRLPHDFVVQDVALAVERIRDVIRFHRR